MKKIIYTLLIINICISCNTDILHLPTVDLVKDLEINQLTDSTFFNDIRSIYFMNEKYYISEYNRDNVFILDSNLILQKTLGKKGKGPGELLGASHIFVTEDENIYVLNDAKKVIETFNKISHISTHTMPKGTDFSSDLRFCLDENSFFLSNFNLNRSISKLLFNSDSVFRFGNVIEYQNETETRLKNNRHLHLYQDKLVAIPDCQPVIELYSTSGILICQTNLENIDIINNVLNFINDQQNKPNTYFQFFPDSYIIDNKVFILILSVNKNHKVLSNKILRLEIIDDKIVPQKIINLGEGWFWPICVADKHILAFNQTTAQLIKFRYD